MSHEIEQILYEGNASAFIFDLRNSIKGVRKCSEANLLNTHVNFMLDLNSKIIQSMADIGAKGKFAFNDTGDGCLCVFWDKRHAVTCFQVALDVLLLAPLEELKLILKK